MCPSLFRQDEVAEPAAPGGDGPPKRSDAPSRRRASGAQSLSVLGAGITVEGSIRGHGEVQIEGRVKGDIRIEGQVSVAGVGGVEGELVADGVVVAGAVEGSIRAGENLQVVSGARIDADISAPKLELQDGATLNGRVDMSGKTAGSAGAAPETEEEPAKGVA